MRLSHDSFLRYELEYSYFGLAVDQRDFTLLTEADLQRCTTSSVTICPAEVPFYHAQLLTCEGSVFPECTKLPTVPQERAAPLPHSDSPAPRVEVGVSFSRPTSGQPSLSSGPWVVHPDGNSRRKWAHSQRVHLPYRRSRVEDLASAQQDGRVSSRHPTAVPA